MEDVQPEIDLWESLIVTYVIGANPPTMVMEGFLRRIWLKYGVDKIIELQKGLYLVRLTKIENRDKTLNMEGPFFHSKPMVIKAWKEEMDLTKEVVKTIAIWVKIAMAFKYWGLRALEKIIRHVDKLIRADETTAEREKLNYARDLIEVQIEQAFPDKIEFYNQRHTLEHTTIN
ncbi:Sensory neuron membrane protein 1 [Bienertia sinuspersici]